MIYKKGCKGLSNSHNILFLIKNQIQMLIGVLEALVEKVINKEKYVNLFYNI